MQVGQFVRVDEGRVARVVGAYPIGRAVGPRRPNRQNLPHGKSGTRQPVDEGAATTAETGLERAHVKQRTRAATIEDRQTRGSHWRISQFALARRMTPPCST